MSFLINILYWIFIFFELIIGVYLIIPFVLLVIFFIRKLVRSKSLIDTKPILTEKKFLFNIIVTAHEETAFISPIIDSILKQSYQNFFIYIVADACPNSLARKEDNLEILVPSVALNSKIKSIEYAIDSFHSQPDAIIILDSDNLIHPEFLKVMNAYFQKGFQAVQCDFKAKNSNTAIARLDGIGDLFNFFVEREMRMELGLSSAIWGSGIAIDFSLYKGIIYKDNFGGFDKKLQLHLTKNVKQIAFAKEAILYDEKISTGSALEKQRTRWIHAQYKYFGQNMAFLKSAVLSGNFNHFYMAFLAIRPPLFLLIGLASIFSICNYFINPLITIIWLGIICLFMLSFIIIVRIRSGSNKILKTMFLIPAFILRQIIAMFNVRKAKKSFIKTRHNNPVFINEILKSSKTGNK